MIAIRKMKKDDVEILYDITIRSFEPDYEKYGVYPPQFKLDNINFK